MNIYTERYPYKGGWGWSAIDKDTYDDASDSHCPVGWGASEKAAINDLVEQIIERIEDRLDSKNCELSCLRREIKALQDKERFRELSAVGR